MARITDHDPAPVTNTSAAAVGTPFATSTFDVHSVLDKVASGVVSIDVSERTRRGPSITGAGSGFVISDQGSVLTNNHVVSGASTINTAGVTGANNIGFAINISTVKNAIAPLEQGASS